MKIRLNLKLIFLIINYTKYSIFIVKFILDGILKNKIIFECDISHQIKNKVHD